MLFNLIIIRFTDFSLTASLPLLSMSVGTLIKMVVIIKQLHGHWTVADKQIIVPMKGRACSATGSIGHPQKEFSKLN